VKNRQHQAFNRVMDALSLIQPPCAFRWSSMVSRPLLNDPTLLRSRPAFDSSPQTREADSARTCLEPWRLYSRNSRRVPSSLWPFAFPPNALPSPSFHHERPELAECPSRHMVIRQRTCEAVRQEAGLRCAGMEQAHPEEDELLNKVAKEEYEDALRAKFFGF